MREYHCHDCGHLCLPGDKLCTWCEREKAEKAVAARTNRGTEIMEWIKARWAEGRTVYASTYTRIIKLQPKHADAVRERNGHCEVRMGKRWDSINFCKLTAQ